ncbi:MAG: ABC transporter ATP-binding protein [Anaerolineales bacterium]|nr:ABC transporter ATP-binding protein [Anaerolineales bacterium]
MKPIRELIQYIKPYWKESLAALLLLTISVLMDLAIPRLIQRIVDQGVTPKDMRVVMNTSLWMLGLTVLGVFFAIGNSVLSVLVGEGFARDLRQALFVKIQGQSYGNLDHLQTGGLIVRLTNDVAQVQRLAQVLLRIGTRAPLMMTGSLILMFRTSPRLALYITPLLLAMGLFLLLIIGKVQPFFLVVQQKLDRLNTVLQENLAGVRVVKAFVRAGYENQRFGAANQDLTDWMVKVMSFMAFMFPTLLALINLGVVLVIWIGGYQAIDGALTVGEIMAFTNYLMTTMFPLMVLTMIAASLAQAGASSARIQEVLDSQPTVQESPQARGFSQPVQGRVTLEEVHFSYDGHCQEPVLNSINLSAEPGQTVAILGSTGSGKSTLVNLIPRFYDVSAGQVTIDGVDVRDLEKDALLEQIGIVPQESVLFSGSVRDNIRYGKPQATDEEVIAAAKAAQAHDFIMSLPQGYDAQISQRGKNLSGGQKQRIAIARALLLQPKILILDDSTSSVDVETEGKIQEALQGPMCGCTRFVIAQRISTVLNADKIVVLEHGRIVAQGAHRELLENSPVYQEIYESQLGNGNFHLQAGVGAPNAQPGEGTLNHG